MDPHDYWQRLDPPGTHEPAPGEGYRLGYPAALPDGRRLLLPIRLLPGDAGEAVGSFIVNQAGFSVTDALADIIAGALRRTECDIVVGVPTLGLCLAELVARRLGHTRLVPLGTSRKFWYDEALSEPLGSVTTPDMAKRLYVDPRMRDLVAGRRVLLIDDAVSSGRSMAASLRLLAAIGVVPAAIGVAMLQTERWQATLGPAAALVTGAFRSPLLARRPDGAFDVAAEQG